LEPLRNLLFTSGQGLLQDTCAIVRHDKKVELSPFRPSPLEVVISSFTSLRPSGGTQNDETRVFNSVRATSVRASTIGEILYNMHWFKHKKKHKDYRTAELNSLIRRGGKLHMVCGSLGRRYPPEKKAHGQQAPIQSKTP
jgi:hypothetical protein